MATPDDKACVTQQEHVDAQLDNVLRSSQRVKAYALPLTSLAVALDLSKLPKTQGCHKLVDGIWKDAQCVDHNFLKAHNLALPAPNNNTIQTAASWRQVGPSNWVRYTAPIFWGSIEVNFISDPKLASEINGLGGKTNEFSLQLNTNSFPCTGCTTGYPFPADSTTPNIASQVGDQGWVQFVYQQYGDPAQGYLCVWNIDLNVAQNSKENGYKAVCVTTPVQHPLTGAGASSERAQIIGYESCTAPDAACTLSAVAYLPWAQGWYQATTLDLLGLNSQWTDASGTLFGVGNGSSAIFSRARLQTTVRANSCFILVQDSTGSAPQDCGAQPFYSLTGIAIPTDVTGESNNLLSDPSTLSCSNDECILTFLSHNP
jgi:hypothetical protein